MAGTAVNRAAIPLSLLRAHHAHVPTDNPFQRQARLLQALWREHLSLPIGHHNATPLGSRLDPTFALSSKANFLTPTIREVVTDTLANRTSGQLIDEDRLFSNLLSSQPLCFNLFGEPSRDLDLATTIFRALAPDRVDRVLEITFEHSPGRGDLRFTGDRSAFDVFVTYVSPKGRRGFLGIEVKYHEALGDPAAAHRRRYDEVADAMACFVPDRALLRKAPLQQIWRDHLLAGALVHADLGYDEGVFVFLSPAGNLACRRALTAYRKHLTRDDTFVSWTLEDVLAALARIPGTKWAEDVFDRYLAFARVECCALREAPRSPCPACGHASSLPILRGEPEGFLGRMAARREVVLGGCLVGDGMPGLACAACGHEWGEAVDRARARGPPALGYDLPNGVRPLHPAPRGFRDRTLT